MHAQVTCDEAAQKGEAPLFWSSRNICHKTEGHDASLFSLTWELTASSSAPPAAPATPASPAALSASLVSITWQKYVDNIDNIKFDGTLIV